MLSIKKYQKVLKEIQRKALTFTEMQKVTGIPQGTLSKSLKELRNNFLTFTKDKKYYLTKSGRYLLDIYKKIEEKNGQISYE